MCGMFLMLQYSQGRDPTLKIEIFMGDILDFPLKDLKLYKKKLGTQRGAFEAVDT